MKARLLSAFATNDGCLDIGTIVEGDEAARYVAAGCAEQILDDEERAVAPTSAEKAVRKTIK